MSSNFCCRVLLNTEVSEDFPLYFLHAKSQSHGVKIGEQAQLKRPGRKVEGIAACLLPYEADGSLAREAFAQALQRTDAAGLQCAVNMDTGYANYLTEQEREEILDLTREALGPGVPFVAGVFVEGLEGDLAELYRRGANAVVAHGGTPILIQTTRFHEWSAAEIAALYAEVCAPYERVLAFELGRMFAPNGLIFSEETVQRLMAIPSLKGIKHSSLCRFQELTRLALRDQERPDFRIYTGNDLGIDMIEYGSDYLLGLAAFCPEKFAQRDQAWAEGDAETYAALHDGLQYLGNVAFRAPVPAYKHSCAVFQHLLGRIPTDRAHPQCPIRATWESDILRDCAGRLGLETAPS